MNFCISGLLAAFSVSFLLGSAESLAQNAYITNYSDGSVSVIDTATNAVTGSGATGSCLGQYFCNGIAVTPDGSKVYVVANAAAGNARQRTGHAIPSGRAAIL